MVIFVENPTATAATPAVDEDDSSFISVIGIPACSKMKYVFDNLVYPEGKWWNIHEWVGLNK